MNIPVVDLQLFIIGTPEEKVQFAGDLGKAFEEVGFVSVKNHGIDQHLIDTLYSNVQSFFGQAENIKRQYEVPGLAGCDKICATMNLRDFVCTICAALQY